MEERNKTKWFEKLRLNSWEVEILIVGFVLVMLLNIPDVFLFKLDELGAKLSFVRGDELVNIIRMMSEGLILAILTQCIYILIYSFSIYLGLRGFWVGILGLSSVFPHGINMRKLNMHKIFSDNISQYKFNDFILKVDHICSSIFSISFLISFSLLSISLFVLEFAVFSLLLDVFLQKDSLKPLLALISGSFFLLGILFFFDYICFGILKKIKWKPFAYCFNLIDRFFRYVTLVFIYDALYYVFISNMKRRYILLFLTFVISFQYIKSNTELDSYTYFPEDRYSSYVMDYRNYENQIKLRDNYESDFFPKYPFINFDVIDGNLLKIYIPYFPNQNRALEEVCPDLLNDSLEDNQIFSSTLTCFNQVYEVFIDDQKISSDFIFYNYSHDLFVLKTCFMIVDVANFSKGFHVLKISNNLPQLSSLDYKDGDLDVKYKRESTKNHEIPFYISR